MQSSSLLPTQRAAYSGIRPRSKPRPNFTLWYSHSVAATSWLARLPPSSCVTTDPRHKRRLAIAASAAAAAPAPDAQASPASKKQPNNGPIGGFWRSFWAFVDVVAIFGAVGGAVAALLGIGTTMYVLALPMVLPIVSLIAALNREGLIAEVRQHAHAEAAMSCMHVSRVPRACHACMYWFACTCA